jgi:CheY-like chemotaxis protein
MTNKRILLVEDNEDNSKLVCFLLERAGYEIIEARNGQQGMELARTELPDMILMDLSLPEVDGWTAARELKADPRTRNIPTYALTAHTLPGDRSRALESGFDGYLSKPINVHSFVSAVAECLKAYKKPED